MRSIGQPFTEIQPRRFEPPGRSSEADEVRASPENIELTTTGASGVERRRNGCFRRLAAISIVKNGECLDGFEQFLCTVRSVNRLISSML